MSTEENKALIRRYLEEVRKDKSPAALAPYVNDQPLSEHIAFYDSVLPGYWIEVEDLIAEGDKVVCRGMIYGTHKGDLMGIPPTGKDVAFGLIIIYQIAEGKIVNHWMQTDGIGLLQQLGALPAPA